MKIALCYESVLPSRGGCETYIATLARKLVQDRHEVHLYASRWDAGALPEQVRIHPLVYRPTPRFLRAWRFAVQCEDALRYADQDVSIGFDKTWGQDVLYPQGGLHQAMLDYSLRKYRSPVMRGLAVAGRWLDPAQWCFAALERRQYLGTPRPLIVVNSEMSRRHFIRYGAPAAQLRVIHSAVDQSRFAVPDRPRRRLETRQSWAVGSEETVGLFVAMNYRLKGLEPLLRAVRLLPRRSRFRVAVVGSQRTGPFQRIARSLGVADRVLFLGPRRDVHNCFFAADFLVHPTFYDPCSLVVLEAIACGLPVITTRYNGAGELLHPPSDSYVLDDPRDIVSLASAMEEIFDPQRRAACAARARRTASEWTFDQHYHKLLPVLSEAATRRKAA